MRLALELGLRDYVTKNGFGDVVIGLSGGIDSALTAALCVEALGAERVHGVSMPSRYSSDGNARRRAAARRVARHRLPRDRDRADGRGVHGRAAPMRSPAATPDLTEENLQARIRGTLLMALSNKFGWLVIATGNKSELSVGYSTLYGDLAGGFALIKDVYKTDVFRLAAVAERARGPRADPAVDHRARAERRAARRPAATRTRCRRTRSSTACSRRTSSSTARAKSSPRTASTPTSSTARSR